ncbi:MAG: hypothetical protein P8Y05_10020 [Deinococcales bacterium]
MGFSPPGAIIFFAVGETHGWYLGVLSHSPVFVFKKTATGEATRQTFNVDALPVQLTGTVRHGTVEVKVFFQRPESFQSSTGPGPNDMLFDKTYQAGERIAIDQSFKGGKGDYIVRLIFSDATGLFRLRLPDRLNL